ncbi:MAG: CRISPR-associated helicase Cas3' [Coriobacteriales bacterium]|nr:CRISPR-associated helicase Cas3' [Coriobacteriales bacterium]
MSPEVAALRNREHDSLGALLEKFENHMKMLECAAQDTLVNMARSQILSDCFDAASGESGLFTLSVPTGGGKTLSSMQFALRHAVLHGMRHVIYAIPFTSVAQQTAEVFRSVFGSQNVLEHHSAHVVPLIDDMDEGESNEVAKGERLATQNWDAPIIVTTNVQLLESLYANTPSKCRKLHNVAGSVIVLDEAQTLPDSLLKPTLAMLEALCIDFSTSVVLCTATQPALEELWPFASKPKEIAVHTDSFAQAFAGRVQFTPLVQMERAELVEELSSRNQALCVVGTKKKARNLYLDVIQVAHDKGMIESGGSANDSGFFHLSTNMVAVHRLQAIEEIRRRLSTGERCVVVSTQLIEAGVDVDFPEAYREIAGIDSLMQVAGRCNREGRQRDCAGNSRPGIVHIFELEEDLESQESGLVRSWLGSMKNISKNLIKNNGGEISEGLVGPFFLERYSASPNLDKGGILESISGVLRSRCETLEYERYAIEYKIIEGNTDAVYVPWDHEARRLLELARKLSATGESSVLFMPLQRYSVGVYPHILNAFKRDGCIETVGNYHVLVQDACMTRYSQETGLLPVGESELNNLVI